MDVSDPEPEAVASLQRWSIEQGIDNISIDKIDAEIKVVPTRRER